MLEPVRLIDAKLEEAGLTLEQLSMVCAVDSAWVMQHIDEGFLTPSAGQSEEWRFSSAHLLRVRRMASLERDFDALPELAALVADMQEEMDALRRRLRQAGLE